MSSLEVINQNNTNTVNSYLETLEHCVVDRISIIITYRKNGDDISKDRQVDPYRIIYWKNKWYLIAFCHVRDDVRTFRTDRIVNLTLTTETFDQLDGFTVDNYFVKNLLPILENERTINNLVISGDVSILDDVCNHWFLGNYLKERTFNQAEFQIEEDVMHKYIPQILLPYGKEIKVLKPISLKEEMIKNLSDLIEFYQK